MSSFGDYAPFYNLMYREKVYGDEASFVTSEIGAYKQPIETILDLGCGTGTHALRFAEAGRRVCGVDLSAGMLELARRNVAEAEAEVAARVRFELSDIRNLHLDETFDAVVSLFHVMSYQTCEEDLTAAIRSARRHLPEGGAFLFDFWHGPAVIKSGPSARQKEVENDSVRVVRTATPTWKSNRNLVDVAYHFTVYDKVTGMVREFDETHSMRYFFPADLERALERGGFQLAKCAEWLTGKSATEDSFSAYMVAIATG